MVSSNNKQPSSFDEMTLLYKRFLRLIALLPFNGQAYTCLATRVLLVCYIVTSTIHWSMFVFSMINGRGMPPIDTICETVVIVGLNLRYYLLLPRRLEFANLLEESRAIWQLCDEEGHRVVHQFERKVRLLFLFLLSSCIFLVGLYALSAAALTVNAARNNDTVKHFLLSPWYVEDGADLWPGYRFNLPLQLVVVLNGSLIATTVDTATPLLIMIVAGYFRALRQLLFRTHVNALENDDEPLRADHELVACFRLHQRILKHCSKIDEISRSLFFVQLLCTGYNTSLIGLKLAGTDPDKYKYAPLAVLNLGQLFICQWAPEHLINESEAISTAAYCASCPWMKRRIGRLLVLMIVRAQRPVQMTAAGVVNLSLENFGSMLKGALSFFTVLRSFDV